MTIYAEFGFISLESFEKTFVIFAYSDMVNWKLYSTVEVILDFRTTYNWNMLKVALTTITLDFHSS
jgi:hypothetical protein